MKKIGLFLDEIKDQKIDSSQKFSKLGYNTGNMLFWHSLKTQLNLDIKSRWYIDHPDQLNLGEYKAFVTTDLIWIRQMQDFSYLNKTLDAIGDLPLIPISIGLQCDDYISDFKLHQETVKVLNRISERCVMGVRGNYTAEILTKYGIQNFKVIGCPSMYMNTPGLLTVSNSGQPCNVSMNFETFYSHLDENRINLLEYGMENNFSFVEQAQAELTEKHISDVKRLDSIKKWLETKRKCFFDINEWRSYIRECDFSIGSRFHGNVLALWENVPALFITCDSRTQELCEYFMLPGINIKQFDKLKPIEYYYKLADYSDFKKKYGKLCTEYNDFLRSNSLLDLKPMAVNEETNGSDIKMSNKFYEGFDKFNEHINQIKKEFYICDSINLDDSGGEIDFNEMKDIPQGRFSVKYSGVNFDCLFNKKSGNKLYVFLMGGISKQTKYLPNFQRNNFANIMEGSSLYIADPMYMIYKEQKLCTAWYYGNAKENYLDYVKQLVQKIASILSIDSSNIVFYGSSADGYAALTLASVINGAKCIAINPQINLTIQRSWINSREFEQITGNDLGSDDERNDIAPLISNNLAERIVLVENSKSQSDMDQLQALCSYLNCSFDFGLNKIGRNILLWVYDALPLNNLAAHNSQEFKAMVPLINDLLNVDMNNIEQIKHTYFAIGLLWSEHYEQIRKIESLEKQIRIICCPSDTMCEIGKNAFFSVSASGEKLTYCWYVSFDNGKNWKPTQVKGFNTSEIEIENVNSDINGWLYKCCITDIWGNKLESKAAKLTVINIQTWIPNTVSNVNNAKLNEILNNQYYILKSNSISVIQTDAFMEYKNSNVGKDVVLLGTGPSLNKFQPLDNCVYCGVNKSFLYNKVKLDYLFMVDYNAVHSYIRQADNYDCKKFYGIIRELWPKCVIPQSVAANANAKRFYLQGVKNPIQFTFDICNEPLGDSGSVIFSAMQFLLWTNPRKIYIVGCDCTLNVHYDTEVNETQQKNNLTVYNGWLAMKDFAKLHYPDTEIISVNPVGLKGVFTDLIQ